MGKIFDPSLHLQAERSREFSQFPQALLCDSFIRVYFSTRHKDVAGNYLSEVAFADFDKQFSKVLNVSRHCVIPLGGLGAFDEHGIFPLHVVREGKRVLGYTTGINRKISVPNDSAIGLAVSVDEGFTFNKVGEGPVLGASLHEPFLVADACVRKYGDRFHMWYIFGLQWTCEQEGATPDRVYKIGHATSDDGISWSRTGVQLIADRLASNECQAAPTVEFFNGMYHLFFCYRPQFGFRTSGYRLGYAFSSDLIHWTRDDSRGGLDVSEQGWDSEMVCYPSFLRADGKIYLLYNGNAFGRFGFGVAEWEG